MKKEGWTFCWQWTKYTIKWIVCCVQCAWLYAHTKIRFMSLFDLQIIMHFMNRFWTTFPSFLTGFFTLFLFIQNLIFSERSSFLPFPKFRLLAYFSLSALTSPFALIESFVQNINYNIKSTFPFRAADFDWAAYSS